MALIARARKKRKPVAEMNVVPYIDVMLVLLVIFMVTAPMLNQGVKVDLPKVSSEALPQDNNTRVLTISIKADKTYYWNLGSEVDTEKQQDRAMTLPQMTDAVTKIIRAGTEGGKRTQCSFVVTRLSTTAPSWVPWAGCRKPGSVTLV